MPRVLITAFEPYEGWAENSSWLTLMELTRSLPTAPQITTRRYPVAWPQLRERLASDLAANYDVVLHLSQAVGVARIRLEAIAINVGGQAEPSDQEDCPLAADGPLAFRTLLPLAPWAAKLRRAGIPCQVSYHAGTHAGNAAFYLSQYLADRQQLKTRAALIHLPLEMSQLVHSRQELPALPCATMAAAIRLILDELAAESE